MPTIAEVRAKYPQYNDLSDEALAGALHKKFYSDMPEADFKAKIGLMPESDTSKNLRSDLSAITQNPAKAQYDALPGWQKPLVAASDIVDLTANGLTYGFGNKAAALARSYGTGNSYDAELADMQRKTAGARARSGAAGDVAEIAGGLRTALTLGNKGLTLAGVGGTGAMTGVKGLALRSALMGGEGALYGAASGAGNSANGNELADAITGAKWGAAGGALGNVAAEGVGKVTEKLSRAWQNWRAAPDEKAANAVLNAAREAGLDEQSARRMLSDLGPDAMAVDILGKRGTALGRTAANVSPEARETLESALLGRKAGQNERLVGTLEDLTGLPAGNRAGVDALKAAQYETVRPAINDAYNLAKEAGYDLPREPFRSILESPMGKAAYDDAANSLLNRSAVDGADAASELARLDQTKRTLDGWANKARRAGDNDVADQASALARKLRETMDQSIAGPEYATARGLRQKAYRVDDAFNMGRDLAGGRVPIGLPQKAAEIAPENAPFMGQAYAAQQAENLLNRNATEGAYAKMSTPLGQEAYQAALGDKSGGLTKALAAERKFNATTREITGNSTTARQLAEQMLGTGGAGAVVSYLTGGDPFTGGALGLLPLAKRGLPMLQKHFATKSQKAAAPYVAELLTRKALPAARAPKQGALEKLAKSKRDALVRLLMGMSIHEGVAP